MKIDSASSKQIKIMDKYFKELSYLHASFETYFLMKYGNKEWEKAYKISPAFFSLVRKSLFSEAILTLCKFMEGYKNEGRSDLNLNSFLNKLKRNKEVFRNLSIDELNEVNESFDRYLKKIESYEETIKKLLVWRDKVIAHFDKKDESKILENAPITADGIRELISFIGEILNFYYYRINMGCLVSYKYTNFDDINRLMGFILKNY